MAGDSNKVILSHNISGLPKLWAQLNWCAEGLRETSTYSSQVARGRPHMSVQCDACRRPEHWVTYCKYVPGLMLQGYLDTPVQSAAAKAGWSSIREPAIPTHAGLCRPDLVFHHPERATFVLDVTIVVDNAVLDDAHSRKV